MLDATRIDLESSLSVFLIRSEFPHLCQAYPICLSISLVVSLARKTVVPLRAIVIEYEPRQMSILNRDVDSVRQD